MKPISTALALGRTLLLPLGGVQVNLEGTHGCAWGMIHKATGDERYRELQVLAMNVGVGLPCACKNGYLGGMAWGPIARVQSLTSAIVHLFNHHVCSSGDMTMDGLIDWIAAHEPDVPEPTDPVTVDVKEVVHESL